MGTYRFILAMLVLYSHAFGRIFGINPGVAAVISFFVISGYVMTLLIEKNYPRIEDIPSFYLDRAARLYPQYLFYVVATLAVASAIVLEDPYLTHREPIYILANIAILPLGYYMFGLDQAIYVPPAWSLGLEMTFYLVFPFFWLMPKWAKMIVLAASGVTAAIAYLGVINTDWFGYRFLAGTFFIFAAGAALAQPKALGTTFAAAIAGIGLFAHACLWVFPTLWPLPYNAEVTLGTCIGICAIAALRKLRRSALDEYLGNLSYGVFLSHYLFIFIADRFGIDRWMIVPGSAILAAVVTYELVEKPVLKLRRKLRSGRSLSPHHGAEQAA